jgi:EAL domain-containing protein (putative c-di-GMP-specific phosphodiesterase class I)/ActR/RegA family two-component response regulator
MGELVSLREPSSDGLAEAQPVRDVPPKSVLVVDDEPSFVRAVARVLSGAGFYVTTAHNGAEAADAIASQAFEAILSDIQMPELSGVDLLSLVRTHDLDVPVILMTAAPTLETALEAVSLGALQYLVKPVPNDKLIAVVERACRLHRIARMKRDALRLLGQEQGLAGDRAGLQSCLDRAIDTMWMAFQPIVDSRGRRVFGYEALLRHEEPSLPGPTAVIAAAERLGRLPALGASVRQLAATAFTSAPADTFLFVNVHTHDLLDADLYRPDAPLTKLADRVVLEITERAAIDDVTDVRARVANLRRLGFRIAIDDLGAGYAGLSSFAALEPEIVKLDMSLVRNVHESPIRQRLIGSMTSLCIDMGMQVIAEGIESSAECATVRSFGCNLLQGFLFAEAGRPFPEVSW